MVRIKVEGLEEVADRFDSLDSGALMDAAVRGLGRGLEYIKNDAVMNVPVDTGNLKNHIMTEVSPKGETLEGTVKAATEYAIYVEMGTGPNGEASHAGVSPDAAGRVTYSPKGWVYMDAAGKFHYTRGQPARPFLYPAFKANSGKAVEEVVKAVASELRKQLGG